MLGRVLLTVALAVLASVSSVHSARLYHRDGALAAIATRPTTPRTWAVTAVAPTSARHTVTIALHLQQLDYMQQLFHDIHDPTHPQWLNHLTREQIHAIIAPPAHITDKLLQWMQAEQGVPVEHVEYLIGANAIRVNSTIGHINRLFNTTMHEYTHTDGRKAYRQLGGSYVPDEFAPLIHIVDGLAMMPLAMRKHGRVIEMDAYLNARSSEQHGAEDTAASGLSKASLAAGIPKCTDFNVIIPVNSLYGWYNITDQSSSHIGTNPTTSTKSVQFFTGTSPDDDNLQPNSFSPSDLTSYSQLWSQSASGSALKVQTVLGPNNASDPTGEPSLDVQSMTALNPLAANQFELVDGDDSFVFTWAAGFVSRTNIAQVVSISYGQDESEFLRSVPSNDTQEGILVSQYLAATNNLFMVIGARGTTILASSGDDGAQGLDISVIDTGARCNYTTNPDNPSGPIGPSVSFPASSPYVTAVGGTEIGAPCSSFVAQLSGTTSPICSNFSTDKFASFGIKPAVTDKPSIHCLDPHSPGITETAVSIAGSGYTSGGGFSRDTLRSKSAPWQDSVVGAYLSNGGTTPSAALFNRSGRAVPDVAMYGSNFPVLVGGELGITAGTSLSSPLFAAIIALLNQQTLAAKGATIGFANPLLYAMAAKAPSTFRDITSGDNICPSDDGTPDSCPDTCQGYAAVKGWDPVTGLGVPNVGAMQTALSQFLTFVDGRQTGSVTGATGRNGAAGRMSQWTLLPLLMVVVAAVAVLAW